jgi:hypothetical protein
MISLLLLQSKEDRFKKEIIEQNLIMDQLKVNKIVAYFPYCKERYMCSTMMSMYVYVCVCVSPINLQPVD